MVFSQSGANVFYVFWAGKTNLRSDRLHLKKKRPKFRKCEAKFLRIALKCIILVDARIVTTKIVWKFYFFYFFDYIASIYLKMSPNRLGMLRIYRFQYSKKDSVQYNALYHFYFTKDCISTV